MANKHEGGRGAGDAPDLDDEMERLIDRMPAKVGQAMRKVRSPEAAPYRIPAGVALTVGGVFGFLPVLG